MKEQLIDFIYSYWCDSKHELPEVSETIQALCENASLDKGLIIEEKIMECVTKESERAFKDGFLWCLEFINGRILQ